MAGRTLDWPVCGCNYGCALLVDGVSQLRPATSRTFSSKGMLLQRSAWSGMTSSMTESRPVARTAKDDIGQLEHSWKKTIFFVILRALAGIFLANLW